MLETPTAGERGSQQREIFTGKALIWRAAWVPVENALSGGDLREKGKGFGGVVKGSEGQPSSFLAGGNMRKTPHAPILGYAEKRRDPFMEKIMAGKGSACKKFPQQTGKEKRGKA